nr:unnamed protein product [Digitaria exilis]
MGASIAAPSCRRTRGVLLPLHAQGSTAGEGRGNLWGSEALAASHFVSEATNMYRPPVTVDSLQPREAPPLQAAPQPSICRRRLTGKRRIR